MGAWRTTCGSVSIAVVLLTVIGGCGGSGERGPKRPLPQARTSVAPERPGPGDHQLELAVGGRRWQYLLHAPLSYNGSGPVPLVLALHGSSGTPDSTRKMSNLDAKADKAGFIAVFPRGQATRWNPTPGSADAAFLRALVRHLQQVWKADPKRTYLTGFSIGGAMTAQAGAELADLFAAVAPVSPGGAVPDLSMLSGRAAPALIGFYGDQDDSDPPSIFAAWRQSTGCGKAEVRKVEGIPRESSTCRGGADTVVYALPDMAHDWPGGGKGTALEDSSPISATDLMWEFFKAHPMQ
jgi:polyhydroxybutyrate depolymerase